MTPEFAQIYTDGAQVVALEADVVFNQNGVSTAGFFHAPGASWIVVSTAGTYEIFWTVTAVEPNQFAIIVNGVPLAGSVFGSGAGTQQNSGQVMVTLAAGDVVTLRNHTSSAAVTLQTLAGGTQTNTVASMMLRKLD